MRLKRLFWVTAVIAFAISGNAFAAERLQSVQSIEKGRPIRNGGVGEGTYSSSQLQYSTYDYVTDDQPAQVKDEANGYFYIYDERGYLVRRYYKPSYSNVATDGEVYEYDDNGRLKTRWTVSGSYEGQRDASTIVPTYDDYHESFEYDAEGRLTRSSFVENGHTDYYYDDYGRLVREHMDNYGSSGAWVFSGLEHEIYYTYNDSDRSIKIESGTTVSATNSGSTGVKYSGKFICDEDGRIIERQIGLNESSPTGAYRYTYDDQGRVVKSDFLVEKDGSLTPGTCSMYYYK